MSSNLRLWAPGPGEKSPQRYTSDAEIVQEPTDQPWGTRDFAVRDPSGNMVRIDEQPAA